MAGSGNGTPGGGGDGTGEVVLVEAPRGIAVIGARTELKGLHYFDGKFLRAQDLETEQAFLRYVAALVAQGGGAGVVHGFDVTGADGASVLVKQGLAFDARGRPLYLTVDQRLDLGALVAATEASAAGASGAPAGSSDFRDCTVALAAGTVATAPGTDLYLLTVGFLEALCGEEDVFGKLCEDACVDAKNRRFVLDGVVFRAVPLAGLGALPASQNVTLGPRHYRSRVASAYFEAERRVVSTQITGGGVRDGVFCLGAPRLVGDAVPIAMFSRAGGTTTFVDAWIARRERIEPPNRRYWAWRMSMRPWDVFLAQIFQFQCQLADALGGVVTGGGGDPCAPKTAVIGQAQEVVSRVEAWLSGLPTALGPDRLRALPVQPFELADLSRLKAALADAAAPTPPQGARILIDGGLVELPSAGYLPVSIASPTVNRQVRDLMGPGVDLRFCVCRPDFVPHVLEAAQHMERISLLEGIDDPARMPHVDVFVPDGQAAPAVDVGSRWFDAQLLDFIRRGTTGVSAPSPTTVLRALGSARASGTEVPGVASMYLPPSLEGAARWAPYGEGGHAFYWAGTLRTAGSQAADVPVPATWFEANVDRDPFALDATHSSAQVYARVVDLGAGKEGAVVTLELVNLRFTPKGAAFRDASGDTVVEGQLEGTAVPLERPSTGDGAKPYVSMSVRLRRAATAGGGSIMVEPLLQDADEYRWEWTAGTALEGALHVARPAEQRDVVVFRAKEDPDARIPSNPFHALSELAIPMLQRQVATAPFDLPRFGTDAEQALFPPPVETPSLDVTATRDWVLFARRRECSCGDAGVAPAADERFQVWSLDAAALGDEGDRFLERLVSRDPADVDYVKRLLKPVGFVAFPATGSSLRDAAAAVNDARAALGGATVLVGAAIGQQPPQDPQTLEAARLEGYATVLQQLLLRDPKAELKTLPIMPPALEDPNVRGAIVVAVRAEDELVFRVAPKDVRFFRDQLLQGVKERGEKFSTLFQPTANRPPLSRLVGVGRFDAGGAALQPSSDDLAATWASLGDGEVTTTWVVVDAKETEAVATIVRRRDAVVASLGLTAGNNEDPVMLSDGSWDVGPGTGDAFRFARSAIFLVAGSDEAAPPQPRPAAPDRRQPRPRPRRARPG